MFWASQHYLGNLESTTVGIFTPWKLANTTNQDFLSAPKVFLPKHHDVIEGGRKRRGRRRQRGSICVYTVLQEAIPPIMSMLVHLLFSLPETPLLSFAWVTQNSDQELPLLGKPSLMSALGLCEMPPCPQCSPTGCCDDLSLPSQATSAMLCGHCPFS